jgi:hypothetical protein
MLAQSLQIALRRLATGFERDAQNIQRIEQSGHHVSGAAQRADQLGAFFIAEAHGQYNLESPR